MWKFSTTPSVSAETVSVWNSSQFAEVKVSVCASASNAAEPAIFANVICPLLLIRLTTAPPAPGLDDRRTRIVSVAFATAAALPSSDAGSSETLVPLFVSSTTTAGVACV